MVDQNAKLPTYFWIIVVVGLLWNLLGVMNFFGQTFITEEGLATLPQEQQDLIRAVPLWMTIVFAVAVFGGTLGCIGLLLKKAWAVPLFLISLVAVVIQVSYNFIMVDIGSSFGPMALGVAVLVLIIGIFLFFFSRRSKAKGWIR